MVSTVFSVSLFGYLLLIGIAMMVGIWYLLRALFRENTVFWRSTAQDMQNTVLKIENLRGD
jgi:hypothetical protein